MKKIGDRNSKAQCLLASVQHLRAQAAHSNDPEQKKYLTRQADRLRDEMTRHLKAAHVHGPQYVK